MPITVGHALTATTPDNPSWEIQPQHWNSNHVATISANGSEIFGAFSNSNGVSFGLNGSTITASHNGLTTAAQSNHSHGNPTLALTNLTGTTASASNGFTLSLSGNAAQSVQPVAFSAPGGSSAFSTLVFANSNGVSFSNSNGSVVATVATNYQSQGAYLTTARASNDAVGLNSAVSNVTATINSAGLSLDARGYAGTGTSATNASITLNSNGLAISVAAPGGGGGIALYDGANSISTGTAQFSNANGVTFGFNGQTITASVAAVGGAQTGISSVAVSDATYTSGQISFRDGNGLTWASTTGQGISIVHGLQHTSATSAITSNALHSTASRVAAINGSQGTMSFTVASSLSMSTNGSTISFGLASNITTALQAAGAYLTTARASNDAIGLNSGLTANGVSVTANSSGLSLNFPAFLTTAAASNHSHGNPTLALTNLTGTTASASNGLTLSLSGPSVTQYFSNTATTFNGANISGSITLNTNGLQLSLSAGAGGGVTPVASASNGSFSFTTLAFSNANNVTFGTSAGSIITASVAAPGAAAEQNAINLLGANTAGNTTATGSTIGFSGVNLTLSGTNASQIVFSAPATSSLSVTGQLSISTNGSTISMGVPALTTLSAYQEAAIDREWLAAQVGNNQVFVQPMAIRNPLQFDEICQPVSYVATSNQSGSITLSMFVGFYTRNGSTLSQITSVSSSFAATNSGTVGSYSIYSGIKEMAIPFTTTLSPNNYYIAFLSRTTTGGAAGMTFSNYVASNVNAAYAGRWSSSANATNQFFLGMGSYNTTSTALPGSIAFSQINGSAAANLRPVVFKLVSQDLN